MIQDCLMILLLPLLRFVPLEEPHAGATLSHIEIRG